MPSIVNCAASAARMMPNTFVTMTAAGRDCIARMRADAAVAAGEVFGFAVNMEKAVAFDPATEARIPG